MTILEMTNLLISLLLPLCIGNLVLLIVLGGRKVPAALGFALAYGIGFGLLAQWMIVLAIAEIPFSLGIIASGLTGLSVLLWMAYRTFHREPKRTNAALLLSSSALPAPARSVSEKVFSGLCISIILFSLVFVFWRALNVPIQSWDAIATSAFKAKIFFYDGSIHRLHLSHAAYPLHVPFLESWVAFNLGRWDDLLVKIVFPFTFVSYIIIHYFFLKSVANAKWALGGVILLVSSPLVFHHATIAYREIFMMYYNCTAVILLLWWGKERNDSLLILASLFAGFTTFVKLEGTGYLVIHTLLFLSILLTDTVSSLRDKFKKSLKFIVPGYLLCIPFHIYKIRLDISGFAGRMSLAATGEHFLRFFSILYDFTWNLFFSGNWSFTWFLLLISLMHFNKKPEHIRRSGFLAFTLSLFFMVYIVILTFTSSTIDNPTTLARIIMHFFPLCPLLIVLLNAPIPKEKRF